MHEVPILVLNESRSSLLLRINDVANIVRSELINELKFPLHGLYFVRDSVPLLNHGSLFCLELQEIEPLPLPFEHIVGILLSSLETAFLVLGKVGNQRHASHCVQHDIEVSSFQVGIVDELSMLLFHLSCYF